MGTQLIWRSNIQGSKLEDVDEDSPLPVQLIQDALLRQGLNVFSLTALGTTNLTLIKPFAGQVFGWAIYNSSATVPAQVRLYNKGSNTGGAPVIATDVGRISLRIGVPSTATGAGSNILLPGPIGLGGFPDGIGMCTVTAAAGTLADTDAAAIAAGTLLINIFWL